MSRKVLVFAPETEAERRPTGRMDDCPANVLQVSVISAFL